MYFRLDPPILRYVSDTNTLHDSRLSCFSDKNGNHIIKQKRMSMSDKFNRASCNVFASERCWLHTVSGKLSVAPLDTRRRKVCHFFCTQWPPDWITEPRRGSGKLLCTIILPRTKALYPFFKNAMVYPRCKPILRRPFHGARYTSLAPKGSCSLCVWLSSSIHFWVTANCMFSAGDSNASNSAYTQLYSQLLR